MRVLLRNIKTGEYYGGGDTWVKDHERAHDCAEVTRATNLALQGTMPKAELLELVLSYDNPVCQLAFPITEDWRKFWSRGERQWNVRAAA